MLLFPYLLASSKTVIRTNLTNCYKEDTSLKLNLNTYTLTLGLTPTNKSECHAIEPGVFVNLTLHANKYICDNISLILQNFSYQNTTTIEYNFYQNSINIANINDVFCDSSLTKDKYLQDMPELTFGFVQIYTHSHIMTSQIMTYSQVKTNISGCFSQIFAQMTDEYSIKLITTPTLVCKNLINKKPTTAPFDNYISSIELIFGETTFVLNETQMNSIIDNYNAQKMTTVEIEGVEQVKKIAESDFNTGQMKLTSIQNGLQVQVLYNVIFSQVSIRKFFTQAVFTAGEGLMFYQFTASPSAIQEINSDQARKFNSYKLKLIITQGVDYITYQKIFSSNQYDSHNSIWVIDCDTMTGFQQQQCLNYSEYIRTSNDVDVQLYVGFYDADDNFIFHEQAAMEQHYSCIKELEVRYINNSFIKATCQKEISKMCNHYENYTIEAAYLFVADANYNGNLADLYLTNTSVNNMTNVEFHCVDGEQCNLNKKYVQMGENNYIVLGIRLSGPKNHVVTFSVPTNKLALQNDMIVNYPSLGIGAVCIAVCLILTLYNMVMTMKRVKLIKKKKLKL